MADNYIVVTTAGNKTFRAKEVEGILYPVHKNEDIGEMADIPVWSPNTESSPTTSIALLKGLLGYFSGEAVGTVGSGYNPFYNADTSQGLGQLLDVIADLLGNQGNIGGLSSPFIDTQGRAALVDASGRSVFMDTENQRSVFRDGSGSGVFLDPTTGMHLAQLMGAIYNFLDNTGTMGGIGVFRDVNNQSVFTDGAAQSVLKDGDGNTIATLLRQIADNPGGSQDIVNVLLDSALGASIADWIAGGAFTTDDTFNPLWAGNGSTEVDGGNKQPWLRLIHHLLGGYGSPNPYGISWFDDPTQSGNSVFKETGSGSGVFTDGAGYSVFKDSSLSVFTNNNSNPGQSLFRDTTGESVFMDALISGQPYLQLIKQAFEADSEQNYSNDPTGSNSAETVWTMMGVLRGMLAQMTGDEGNVPTGSNAFWDEELINTPWLKRINNTIGDPADSNSGQSMNDYFWNNFGSFEDTISVGEITPSSNGTLIGFMKGLASLMNDLVGNTGHLQNSPLYSTDGERFGQVFGAMSDLPATGPLGTSDTHIALMKYQIQLLEQIATNTAP